MEQTPAEPRDRQRHTEEEIYAMTPDELKLALALAAGCPASWWSIHPWTDVAEEDEREIRPFAHGMEVMTPDALGDCPGLEMRVAGEWQSIPDWTGDITAAWKWVEEMGRVGTVTLEKFYQEQNKWYCMLMVRGLGFIGFGETAPLAICRAALRWMEATHAH